MRAKISASHIERRACVYVRQSTTAQVLHHAESTRRQYALADRAAALGWPRESIEVIDEDQGRSGASSDGRTGFARLVEGVAHGKVGAVLAVEVSRLARSSPDWQKLLSLCAVAETVVIDEQAVYDPSDRDDKLLLDIKGTMSEAERPGLGLRRIGALRSKARRGQLRGPPPTGYVWAEHGLSFDPDEAVQRAIRLVFDRYAVEPSVFAVARWARETGVLFPTCQRNPEGVSEIEWKQLGARRVYEILRNPTYAGVYTYGRRPCRATLIDGKIRRVRADGRDPSKWAVRIDDAHPAYITWETYVKNQEKLSENRLHRSKRGAPHGGNALLNGLVMCGRCGVRMTARYGKNSRPHYVCRRDHNYTTKICWSLVADPVDRSIEKLFLETMVPDELDVSLAVEQQVGAQAESLDRHWKLRIEQATYEARRAERRYKATDPDNRVVARTLEREWEERLRELEEIQAQHREARRIHRVELSADDRARIRALARNLPMVWKAASTPQADRKAMLALVVEAVALTPIDLPQRSTRVQVAWRTGATTELTVPRPEHGRCTPRMAAARVRELANKKLTDGQIAERLNRQGLQTGAGLAWTTHAVARVRARECIPCNPAPCRHPRVPDCDARGRYSVAGTAKLFGVSVHVVREWLQKGWVGADRESNVLWLTIDDATRDNLHDHLRRTAHRYPRLVLPPGKQSKRAASQKAAP